jgi:hypothetical protein
MVEHCRINNQSSIPMNPNWVLTRLCKIVNKSGFQIFYISQAYTNLVLSGSQELESRGRGITTSAGALNFKGRKGGPTGYEC